ncbi:hypothetical protein MRY87_12825 [bacterium]|nr:hypothetical protein [bacterium]
MAGGTDVKKELEEADQESLHLPRDPSEQTALNSPSKTALEPHLVPEARLESQLSEELLNYRESLAPQRDRSREASLGKKGIDRFLQDAINRSQKHSQERNQREKKRENTTSPLAFDREMVTIFSDPLEFFAQLLKRLEELLIGKKENPFDHEKNPALKKKKKIGRPKKLRNKRFQKKKTGFYHLDEAAEEEEDEEQPIR